MRMEKGKGKGKGKEKVSEMPPSLSRFSWERSHDPNDLSDIFPDGVRVLVVGNDRTTVNIISLQLRSCHYHVTTCIEARTALSVLYENKGGFDVVLTDVHMAGMNGLEMLEVIKHEMDIPVVMMSADSRTEIVRMGVESGACDYLLKPVHQDQLRLIWQHAARKKWIANKEHARSLEKSRHKSRVTNKANKSRVANKANKSRVTNKANHDLPVRDGLDINGTSKRKKRDANKNVKLKENTGRSSSKKEKPHLVWSSELHQKFVKSINEVGWDKVCPQRIVELMNDPRVDRLKVASHLQKYKKYLKKISAGAQESMRLYNSLPGVQPSTTQILAAMGLELVGQSLGSLAVPLMVQPVPQQYQASEQEANHIPVDHGIAFGQPPVNSQNNMPQQFVQNNLTVSSEPSHFSPFLANSEGAESSFGGTTNSQNCSMLVQMAQQGLPQTQSESSSASCAQHDLTDSYHASNIFMNRSSILINQGSTVPSYQSSDSSHARRNASFINQDSIVANSQLLPTIHEENSPVHFEESPGNNSDSDVLDYGLHPYQTNNVTLNMEQGANEGFTSDGVQINASQYEYMNDDLDQFLNSSLINWNFMAESPQSMSNIQEGNATVPCEQNSGGRNDNCMLNYSLYPSQSNDVPMDMGQGADEGFTDIGVQDDYQFALSPWAGSCVPLDMGQGADESFTNTRVLEDYQFALSPLPEAIGTIREDFLGLNTQQGPARDILSSFDEDTYMSTQYAMDHTEYLTNIMSKTNNDTGDNKNAEAGPAFKISGQL